MKVLRKKEFKDNLDYYCDLVFENKEIIQINFKNDLSVYLKPVNENEIR